MTGNRSTSHQYHNSDGLPEPTSTIECIEKSKSTGIFISNSSKISIYNVEIEFCGGKDTPHGHYAGALVFSLVMNVSLNEVVICKAKRYGLHAINIYGTSEVLDSAFLNATVHPKVTDSGNAMFYFSEDFQTTNTVLVIHSSWFMYGETKDNYSAAGGLNVFIYFPSVHVVISDVISQDNIGVNGGNLALLLMTFAMNASSISIESSRIMDGRARMEVV